MSEVDLSLIDRFRAARVSKISDRTMSNDGGSLKTFFGWSAKRRLNSIESVSRHKISASKISTTWRSDFGANQSNLGDCFAGTDAGNRGVGIYGPTFLGN